MTPSRNRRRIRETVAALLRETGNVAPPIDVYAVARRCGAEVHTAAFAGDQEHLSGMLYQDGSHTIIGVNGSHAESRQRFTIAHELGHLVLHPAEDLHVDQNFRVLWRDGVSAQGTDLREIEANEFAAQLLMPAEMLRQQLEGRPIDFENDSIIEELARTYHVSRQAMTFRLTNLGLF